MLDFEEDAALDCEELELEPDCVDSVSDESCIKTGSFKFVSEHPQNIPVKITAANAELTIFFFIKLSSTAIPC